MRVYGPPAHWKWRVGGRLKPTKPPILVRFKWLRLSGETVVSGIAASVGDFRADAFVYKAPGQSQAECVVIPAPARSLEELTRMLGLHEKTRALAQVTIDWDKKAFKINGRDLVHWSYT